MTSNDEQRAADLKAVAEARIGELQEENERLKRRQYGLQLERDHALAACNEVFSGMEWTGDGYSWNPKSGDYRERVVDPVERGARKIMEELATLRAENNRLTAERDDARRLLGEVEMGVGHVVAAAINDFRAWALETRVLRNKTRGWKDALIGKLLDILNARFSNQAAARAEPGRE
jgi:hypothetical protein